MTSDELVAFVEKRQEARLAYNIAAHRIRKADTALNAPEVISKRLATEHDKLQKALDGYLKHEEKLSRAITNVVALRSQLGLEDHNG